MQCNICLTNSNYKLDSPCSYSDKHTYHSECIDQWLKTIFSKSISDIPKCPTCRTELLEEYIDRSRLNYIHSKYNPNDIYIRTIVDLKWQRRLNLLDEINSGRPFYMEPIIYIDRAIPIDIRSDTLTVKIENHKKIVDLGIGIGSKIIIYRIPDITNANIIYVYNRMPITLPSPGEYVSAFPDKTIEFIWNNDKYTAHVYKQEPIISNRYEYNQLLSGYYNTNNYIGDNETQIILADINLGRTEYLCSLLDSGKVPNSSEHYEYTILSKCVEKGLFETAMCIVRNTDYFPVTVDLIEAVENGTQELYTAIVNHRNFCETRYSRRYIEYNSEVPIEVKNLYRSKFNYTVV
jgi:hypothetical protein